jgi:hypothetical protein
MVGETTTLRFRRRPKAVSGDMRIGWRLSIMLLMLYYSRGKKASLAKLHMLNDAMRVNKSKDHLNKLLVEEQEVYSWSIRIEPAFARALDFLVSEGFADWGVANDRTTVKLTKSGISAAEALSESEEIFLEEKKYLKVVAKKLTEQSVVSVLSASKVRE